MYNLGALIIGIILSFMVTFNGVLFGKTNLILSLLIINFVGLISSYILLKIKKEKKTSFKNIPLYLFSGGILSAVVVASNSLSFNALGISLSTALTLLGQSIASTIIDNFGLFGMKKVSFNVKKLPGFFVTILGISSFFIFRGENSTLNKGSIFFIIFIIAISLISGAFVIISMVINSRLGSKIGVMHSTFMNYFVGFSILLLVFLLSYKSNINNITLLNSVPIWAYLGGILGVLVVALSNVVIPKIPAIYSTLLIFIGQLYTGIIIEFFMDKTFSPWKLLGGFFITLGMLFNLYMDRKVS
ncbi:DMT family transporter [Hathewaya massiliensis]|uniref:DMT family transporter n=1 Tax=Hathewaya massiliensis TaxID=1964382 RepID=UPI001157DB43|nr:DMT family transporter [Hathewaya massiliensis]